MKESCFYKRLFERLLCRDVGNAYAEKGSKHQEMSFVHGSVINLSVTLYYKNDYVVCLTSCRKHNLCNLHICVELTRRLLATFAELCIFAVFPLSN